MIYSLLYVNISGVTNMNFSIINIVSQLVINLQHNFPCNSWGWKYKSITKMFTADSSSSQSSLLFNFYIMLHYFTETLNWVMVCPMDLSREPISWMYRFHPFPTLCWDRTSLPATRNWPPCVMSCLFRSNNTTQHDTTRRAGGRPRGSSTWGSITCRNTVLYFTVLYFNVCSVLYCIVQFCTLLNLLVGPGVVWACWEVLAKLGPVSWPWRI